MTKELILAVAQSNLAEVTRLLSQPHIDVNFKDNDGSLSALSTAIANQHWKIAKLLVIHGAQFSTPGVTTFDYQHLNDYVNLLYRCHEVDTGLLKSMAKRVDNLYPKLRTHDPRTCHTGFQPLYSTERALIIFCESLLRFDKPTIIGIMKEFKFEVTTQLLRDYLSDREPMIVEEAFKFTNSISYLLLADDISNDIAEEMRMLIPRHLKIELVRDDLPAPLRSELRVFSQRTLQELFLTFQRQLNGGKALSENQLNPLNLRAFLSRDTVQIMLQLSSCMTDQGKNPAVHTLAEIVLHYGDTLVAVDDKQEPLLSKEQTETALSVFENLHNLSTAQKHLLNMHREQQTKMAAIAAQKEQLDAKLEGLINSLIAAKIPESTAPRP